MFPKNGTELLVVLLVQNNNPGSLKVIILELPY